MQVALFRRAAFAIVNAASCLLYLVTFSVMLIAPYFLVHDAGLSLPQAGIVLASGFVAMARLAVRRPDRRAVGAVASRRSERWRSASGCSRSGTGARTAPPLMALSWPSRGAASRVSGRPDGAGHGSTPPAHRGVAGSLGMLTRTIGTSAARRC